MKSQKTFWRTPQGTAAIALIGAVTYFLLMEHRAHFFQALPFLILLLCPLMHMFMHGGHGHAGQDHDSAGADNENSGETDSEAYRRGLEEGRRQFLKNGRTDTGG
jgi:Protein of unknown function (DUF2933)